MTQPEQRNVLDRIENLVNKMRQAKDLLDFDMVALPFKLSEATTQCWSLQLPTEALQQLANSDPETLDAWAIALTHSLDAQLSVLSQWQSVLPSLPIPSLLAQKINDSYQETAQIALEKSQLLQTYSQLLKQESQLLNDYDELINLQQKVSDLQAIQLKLKTTNIDSLRQEVEKKSSALEPENQILHSLQQQHTFLEEQISELKKQESILSHELVRLRSHQNQEEVLITNTAQELISLLQPYQNNLSVTLTSTLVELKQQQQNYQDLFQKLQTANRQYERYRSETDELRAVLGSHYYADSDLAQHLPVDRQRVESLISVLQKNLEELDQELATARTNYERTQHKQYITFQS